MRQTHDPCMRRCFWQLAALMIIFASSDIVAQETSKIKKVGILWHAADPQGEGAMFKDFMAGMQELGYVEGQNVKYYHTFVDEKYDRFPETAKQLVEQKVDVIVASVANAAAASKVDDSNPHRIRDQR